MNSDAEQTQSRSGNGRNWDISHPKITCQDPASFRNEAQQRNDPTETPRKWHQSALRKLSRLAVCRRIKCANIGNQTLRCPGRLLLLLLLLCNRALRNCFDLIHELRALLIYSSVVDIDASISSLQSANKGDAKCKCAMRNVIFCFQGFHAANQTVRGDSRQSGACGTTQGLIFMFCRGIRVARSAFALLCALG